MSWYALLLTSLALAMDAFAVSVTSSMAHPQLSRSRLMALPVVFAVFQAGMPAIGFAGILAFRAAIESIDHWVAFALLAGIGVHMLLEARHSGEDRRIRRNPLQWGVLLALGIATSIDALAAGIGLAVLDVPLGEACAWIGITTLVVCVPAIAAGRRLGNRLAQRAEVVGGLVLIALGVKILAEHLSA